MKTMSITIDLGCGESPERWIPGAIKIDAFLDDEEFTQAHDILTFDAEQDVWPFNTDTVDEVWSRDGITGMDAEAVLPEILRVLRPQGRLTVISTGQAPEDAERWRKRVVYGFPYLGNEGYHLVRTNEAYQDVSEIMGEPSVEFIVVYQKLRDEEQAT